MAGNYRLHPCQPSSSGELLARLRKTTVKKRELHFLESSDHQHFLRHVERFLRDWSQMADIFAAIPEVRHSGKKAWKSWQK